MKDTKNELYEHPSTAVVYLQFEGLICNSKDKENDPKWNDPYKEEKDW